MPKPGQRITKTIKGNVAVCEITHKGDLITVYLKRNRHHNGRVLVVVKGADAVRIDKPN